MIKGLVFDIRKFTVHDGPGIRCTVFFKGCPLSCRWCHNPESQCGLPETSTKSVSLDGRIFTEEETAGTWMEVDDILKEVAKDRVFYDESGGGITISGGEPASQPEFLLSLLKELKAIGLHTALDTCGHTEWKNMMATMDYIDLYLYDLKIIDEGLHLKYTGGANKLILENLKKLAGLGKKIIVRVPVVPGINDDDESFRALYLYLEPIGKALNEINLLPYHAAAESKYKRFGKENLMKDIKSLPKEALIKRKEELEALGYVVRIGG
ncbi:MAG: glycyl-radical enzyme activating protein [Bacteroidota bacterium]